MGHAGEAALPAEHPRAPHAPPSRRGIPFPERDPFPRNGPPPRSARFPARDRLPPPSSSSSSSPCPPSPQQGSGLPTEGDKPAPSPEKAAAPEELGKREGRERKEGRAEPTRAAPAAPPPLCQQHAPHPSRPVPRRVPLCPRSGRGGSELTRRAAPARTDGPAAPGSAAGRGDGRGGARRQGRARPGSARPGLPLPHGARDAAAPPTGPPPVRGLGEPAARGAEPRRRQRERPIDKALIFERQHPQVVVQPSEGAEGPISCRSPGFHLCLVIA